MKKYIMILLILFLSGCAKSESIPIGEFTGVTVKDKRTEEVCSRGCWDDYFVTFEKDGTIIELEVDKENMYNLFTVGNVVTVSYDDDYFITEVSFPELEGNNSIKEDTYEE